MRGEREKGILNREMKKWKREIEGKEELYESYVDKNRKDESKTALKRKPSVPTTWRGA